MSTQENQENQETSQPPVKRVYGWLRDLPSSKQNFLLTARSSVIKQFPAKLSLTNLPAVYDQGSLGSCTANALGAAFEYEQRKQGLTVFMPSRLFIYYNERKIENNTPYDTGASISDGIKTLTEDGACDEKLCPYVIANFANCPSEEAYNNASEHQIILSRRVPTTVDGFKTTINMGLPIVFGFTVYSSFESEEVSKNGIMPLPDLRKENALGGHAVMCVGYDDNMTSRDGKTKGYLKIRNSWGPRWGQSGYFWMPYDFVDKMGLIADAWVVLKNEEPVKLNKLMSTPEEGTVTKLINFVKNNLIFYKSV